MQTRRSAKTPSHHASPKAPNPETNINIHKAPPTKCINSFTTASSLAQTACRHFTNSCATYPLSMTRTPPTSVPKLTSGQPNKTPTNHKCPFPNCSWKGGNNNTPQNQRPALLRTHFTSEHSMHSFTDISDNDLNRSGLYICRRCDAANKIYLTPGHLKAHMTQHHPESRTKSNIDIISSTLRNLSEQDINAWTEGLRFFHQLQPKPPPFRRSTWYKLKGYQKTSFLYNFHLAVQWLNQSITPFAQDRDEPTPAHLASSIPFVKLLLVFEHLLLSPIKPPLTDCRHTSPAKLLQRRIALFKRGNIKQLYLEAFEPDDSPQTTPKYTDKTHELDFDTTTFCPSAQLAANEDNMHTAFQRVRSSLPVAKLNDDLLQHVKKLYPNKAPQQHASHKPNTRQRQRPTPVQTSTQTCIQTLQRLKRATAPGPFATSIDIIKSYGLHGQQTDSNNIERPFIETFRTLINHIIGARLPPETQQAFSSFYFVALHKDPDNLTKLRPIGIGSALRRVASAVALQTLQPHIQQLLVPLGQFGINLPGGIDFTIHTTLLEIEKYLPHHANSQRALLLLDIHNMFNAVSRHAARHELMQHQYLCALVPFFDYLYDHDNTVWYKTPLGTYNSFLQREGFAQGCPLSGLLAALVLTQVLRPINRTLRARAKRRKNTGQGPNDDNKGSVAATKSIVDDTGICLTYIDLPWFLREFQTLGKPLGIALNLLKTVIITSITGTSPLPFLSPRDRNALSEALSMLDSSEITTGARLLGVPIGSTSFANSFLQRKADNYNKDLTKVRQRLTDTQTKSCLLRYGASPSLAHLFFADVYYNTDLGSPSSSSWHSTFTTLTTTHTHAFASHLAAVDSLPPLSQQLLCFPARQGGIGQRNYALAAVPSFITPILRSIQLCNRPSDQPRPPSFHRQLFDSWHSTANNSRLFTIFRHHTTPLLPLFPHSNNSPPPSSLQQIVNVHVQGLQRHLYHQRCLTIAKPQLLRSCPSQHQHALPALLNPLTSIPLHSLSRQQTDCRLPNDIFTIMLQRKLRLPILPPHLQTTLCKCGKPIDPCGDHFFHCRNYHKTSTHNAIRNCLFSLFKTIAPLSGACRCSQDVLLEPPNLIPSLPTTNSRPADVALHLIPNHFASLPPQHTTICLDVTIAPAPTALSQCQPLLDELDPKHPAIQLAHSVHHKAARDKFCSSQPRVKAINDHNLVLVPFTVDHLGGFGYFAHRLLFSPKKPLPLSPPPPPKPPWPDDRFGGTDARTKPKPDSFQAYQTALRAPIGLIDRANDNWDSSTRFGSSYHQHTPAQWALQHLALNVSSALVQHCIKSISLLRYNCLHLRRSQQNAIGHLLHNGDPPALPAPPVLHPSTLHTPDHDNNILTTLRSL